MKLLFGGLLVVLAIACTSGSHDEPEWMQLAQTNIDKSFAAFFKAFGKSYLNPLEYSKRRDIYRDNLQMIAQNNAASNGNQMRANEFADLTADEFVASMTGLLPVEPRAQNSAGPFRYADVEAPNAMDWREQGAVAPVKNQGACGSCWAFSAVGAIEGINAIVTGDLITLSEQQLVDCDRKEDQGCGGGLMDNAFEYVEANGGLDTEANYAYWGSMGILGCSAARENRTVVSIDGHEDVPPDDEAALKKAAAKQPVSVAICVNGALQFYAGGVFDSECCTQLNHGVLVVGYDDAPADGSDPYWLVKNSWGSSWGEGGFFRLAQGVGKHGQCGLAMYPSYPVKTHGNKPTIDVCGWLGWQTCGVGSSCHCTFSLFNIDWLCFSYDCVPHGDGAQQGAQAVSQQQQQQQQLAEE